MLVVTGLAELSWTIPNKGVVAESRSHNGKLSSFLRFFKEDSKKIIWDFFFQEHQGEEIGRRAI